MLNLEDTDQSTECDSPETTSMDKRRDKIKRARLSMQAALFKTAANISQDSFNNSTHSIKDKEENYATSIEISDCKDKSDTEDLEFKGQEVSLNNGFATERLIGSISLENSPDFHTSRFRTPSCKARPLRLGTISKDSFSLDEQEEVKEGSESTHIETPHSYYTTDNNLSMGDEESSEQYTPHGRLRAGQTIFLRSLENEVDELKKELHVRDTDKIYFIPGNFNVYYEEKDILGEGMSATVKECLKTNTQERFAVKITRYRGDTERLHLVIKEFKNHSRLDHKNIIKVYELYIDYITKKIYVVMELAECNEMMEVIKDLGCYTEAVAAGIFKQILSGIRYLHLSGVCHRDLKPNNILVSKDGKIVKITDFNVSNFSDKKALKKYSATVMGNYKMWTHTGTVAFTAPEVFTDNEYTEAVDMWSAGVVLYTMLCGYQPFQSENVPELMELIKKGTYEFHSNPWDKISDQAKDLIKSLLNVDPKARFTPFQSLTHPWITEHGNVSNITMTGVIENLWAYLAENDNKDKKEMSYLQSNSKANPSVAPKTYKRRDSRNATCKKNGGGFFFTNFLSTMGKTHSSTDIEMSKSPLKLEEAKEEKKKEESESRNLDDSGRHKNKFVRQSSIEDDPNCGFPTIREDYFLSENEEDN